MQIGYDAKRVFQNKTGLGNYSRSLIDILSKYYPQHHYILFAPKITSLFNLVKMPNVKAITPKSFSGKKFPSVWRRYFMVNDIVRSNVQLYHGVSNELPSGIQDIAIKTVVTIHDLIFERYPETYNLDERYVHRFKIKKACSIANKIIAISDQTKNDLIGYYKIAEEKIIVCHQSCNLIFQQKINTEEKLRIKKKYNLPGSYFLFVSSITKRKNLITICKAMVALKYKLDIPLVIIGNGKKEKKEVKQYMKNKGMYEKLLFLNEMPEAKENAFVTAADFPAIYQQALALIYPSIFEGFGLPVLEALWSSLPIICSKTSSLPEAGGDAALYFSPFDYDELAQHMLTVVTDSATTATMRNKGLQHARKFEPQKNAANIMQVYQNLL
jgi:glycosyltransferase involved in cell wall biosynthesis